jgi:hypothetical protein
MDNGLLDEVKIEPISEERIESYHQCLDSVARERLLGHGEFIVPAVQIRSSWFIDLINKFRRWLVASSRN